MKKVSLSRQMLIWMNHLSWRAEPLELLMDNLTQLADKGQHVSLQIVKQAVSPAGSGSCSSFPGAFPRGIP